MEILLSLFILFCIFVIGALFGSFFSLATYRIPRGEDIICTRSYCPNCKHKLSFFDLFPVISYIVRLGKCKYCKCKISPRYILLESLNGILFVIIYVLIFLVTKDPIKTLIFSMCVYIVYAIFFVIIGSKIISKKINNNLNGKKGVYIAELIVAFIVFLILISSSVVISRNYSKSLVDKQVNIEIMQATQQKIEDIKLKAYEEGKEGYENTTNKQDNYSYQDINYKSNLIVEKYQDMENEIEYDFIKKITVTLTRTISGTDISYSLSSYIINYDLLGV